MNILLEREILKKSLLDLLEEFITNSVDGLETEGAMALEMAEEEDDYHLTSYWINDTYLEVENFLMKHYHKEYFKDLCNIIFSKYPNNIEELKIKMGERGNYDEVVAYECLATILLKEYQNSYIWYTVYGSEEEDLIDFVNRYNILNALEDEEDFPVLKMSDVSAAMMGISTSVTPSDLYDVFAYNVDKLINKEYNFLGKERKVFTPDFMQLECVGGRWKAYTDMAKNSKRYTIDFLEKFIQAQKVATIIDEVGLEKYDMIMALQIKDIILDDYKNRFSSPPISFPLHKDNLSINVINLDNKLTLEVKFKIRGIEDKKSVWKDIMLRYYNVPQEPQELMETLFKLSNDIKVELIGMEAQKATKTRKAIPAIEGQYPKKNLATHGLRFINDMNIHYKNNKGRECKKEAKARFTLTMAEKQSLYLLKKTLRYSKDTTISCSFGVDSIVALDLLRRVTKKDFKVIFNNSQVEYNETYQLKKELEKELKLNILETKPVETYWSLLKKNGWNFDRKGDRRAKGNGTKKSNSEICCQKIKHEPFYNLIAQNNFNINISGLRADESRARQQSGLRDSAVYYAKTWNMIRVNPIIFFTNSLVWEYVHKRNLKYSKIYDMKLYWEDVFSNVDEDEFGEVCYSPRTGCWCCAVNTERFYFIWLKKFKPRLYWHLMKDRGLAKTLFTMNAHKMGLANTNIEIKAKKQNSIVQMSLFNLEETAESKLCNNCNSVFDDNTIDELLEKYSVEAMESWITRRPCKFMSIS